MNIIIAGSGDVGTTLARRLSEEGHNLTLIDSDPKVLSDVCEDYDVIGVRGNCAAMQTLQQAGVSNADLLIAAADQDEVNLLCCTTAHGINPKLHTIGRIRNPDYTQQIYAMRDVFALSLAVNPEKQAASEMESLLRFPGFLQRDTFAQGRTAIVELRVAKDSKLCNVTLTSLNSIVKCKVLVCAVLRDGNAITPGGTFVLQEGDRIFVTAPSSSLSILLKNLGIITRRARKVMLCGGSRICFYLAQQLCHDGVSVCIIEQDARQCHNLADSLPEATVIQGDASDKSLLEDYGLSTCDALITLTDSDEMNMIISLYANTRGVPQVITKLADTEYRSISHSLSLGSVISPRDLCCDTIVRYVRAMSNQAGTAESVHTIADGQVEAVEFRVDEHTLHHGTPLKDIRLKPGVLLVSITHSAQTEIPNGNSMFLEGDTIVAVTSRRGSLRQVNDIFA